jgi:hypothetical protein
MSSLVSRMIGWMVERVSNSYAAVRPAGPAPIIIALVVFLTVKSGRRR